MSLNFFDHFLSCGKPNLFLPEALKNIEISKKNEANNFAFLNLLKSFYGPLLKFVTIFSKNNIKLE